MTDTEKKTENDLEVEKSTPEKIKSTTFKFKDLRDIFIFYSTSISNDPVELCEARKVALDTGVKLLPILKVDSDDILKIEKLKINARVLLNKKIPTKTIKFTYVTQGGKERFQIYNISSEDGITYEAETACLNNLKKDFKNQQYERHTTDLNQCINEIGDILVKYDILKAVRYTVDDIIDYKIKNMYQKLKRADENGT